MAGIKVSQLETASNVDGDDLFYIVNNGAPKKINTLDLATVIKKLVLLASKVNGVAADATGLVTLTKTDIGLDKVPNVAPVTTINELVGNLTIFPKVGGGLKVASNETSIEIAIDPEYAFSWSNIAGDPMTNPQLATTLAGVGVLTPPMLMDTAPYELTLDHTKTLWVNVSSPTDVLVKLPLLAATVGTIIELRQEGSGKVGITYDNQYLTLNIPTGSVIETSGRGSRIQIICLGSNAWEFR